MKTAIEVSVGIDIARPRAAVWEFLADPARMPEWLDEFVSSELTSDGPPGVGSVVRYTITPGPRTGTFELIEWDPPRRLAWDGPPLRSMGGAARPRGHFELTEAGEGETRLVATYRPELQGVLVLLRPYLARWLRRQRRADAEKLRALLEAAGG